MVRRSLPIRILGILLKIIVAALIGLTVGVLLWRIFFSANPPKSVTTVAPNDTLISAFVEHGDDLTVFWQKQYTTTTADRNSGYFTITRAYFYPEADQVQLIFRYNNSTLEHLAKDYALGTTPSKAGDYFDLTLVVKEENGEVRRITAEPQPVRDETSLYTYYRITFRGIGLTEQTNSVCVDIYYKEAMDYQSEAYGSLCIYSKDAQNVYEELSHADRDALDRTGD